VLGVRSPTLGAEVFQDGSEHLRSGCPRPSPRRLKWPSGRTALPTG
jgi:predicted  nucleic acid-binding Zn-ribbon protein